MLDADMNSPILRLNENDNVAVVLCERSAEAALLSMNSSLGKLES